MYKVIEVCYTCFQAGVGEGPVFGMRRSGTKVCKAIRSLRYTSLPQPPQLGNTMNNVVPLPYRLFFLYVEPISALAGAYYAAAHQDDYLYDLVTPTMSQFTRTAVDTPTSMTLFQLANLYLLFALNEHLVLSSTSSLKTWRRLLACLLVADLGHLATMAPAGPEIFWSVWRWNAMAWGSVGFVYLGATIRICFLTGVGLGRDGHNMSKHAADSGRTAVKTGRAAE